MKNIKIITFHNAHNYGAFLQIFALQKKIEEKNNVEIINYKNHIIMDIYKIFYIDKTNIRSLFKSVISNILFLNKKVIKFFKFNKIIKNNLNLTQKVYFSEDDLKADAPEADIYITGSDQVWNSEITLGLQDSYTLNFGSTNVKRISYAASIGNSKIPYNEKNIYMDKISRIDYISVREENAKNTLKEIGINKPIEVVLDPTLLLDKTEWDKKLIKDKSIKSKYILAYFIEQDEEYEKILNNLSGITGLKIVHFTKRNKYKKNNFKSAFTSDPFEFVSLIKNAEYVVCTSFHATVFSIIFNKKFWVIPHRKTGSRVTNLLDKLGISERAVNSLEEFEKLNYDKEIDYEKVNKKLDEERKKSINWLNNAINS